MSKIFLSAPGKLILLSYITISASNTVVHKSAFLFFTIICNCKSIHSRKFKLHSTQYIFARN